MGPKPITSPYYGNVSGVVSAIAVDPTDSTIVYIGTVGGGIWKSTDGGTTWTPISDQMPSLSIGSLGIDPSNHLTVYAGTGAFSDGGRQFGDGVLKSIDGGATWTSVGNADGSFLGRSIHQVVVSPQSSSVLYATTDVGISKSIDGGLTWGSIYSFFSNNYASGAIGEIVVDPTTPGTIIAAVVYQGQTGAVSGIMKSTDAGATWSWMTSGLPASGSANRISLAMSHSNHLRLFAAMGGTSVCTLGVFRSDDGGTSWTKLNNVPDIFAINVPGFYYCQGWYDNYSAVDPTNPDVAYVGGIDVWKLTGAGATFTNLTNSYAYPPMRVHPDQHSLGFSSVANGSNFFIGNDGGVWSTNNGGATFTDLNTTLETSLMYHGAVQPPGTALAGLQDNGVVLTTGSTAWNMVYGGDGSAVAIDYNTPSTMYRSAYCSLYVFKSTDGGTTWTQATSGIDPADTSGVMWQPLIIDPNTSTTLLGGAYSGKVYRSINAAGSWSSIGMPDTGIVASLAVASGNSQEIWAGYSDSKLFVTTNGGASWSDRTPNSGLGFYEARGIAVDPNNPQHVFVSYGSDFVNFFPGGANGAVFETNDLGVTWSDITGALASIPIDTLAVDHAGTLYVGTDMGVFARLGGSWGSAGAGLPNVRVNQLILSRDETKLYAATYGRGMWALSPVALKVPGAPTGVRALAGDGEATVTWAPPAPIAGAPAVTAYTVTSIPAGATVTVPGALPATTVTGLTNSTPYAFTVTAINSVGPGPPSAPSNSVTPSAVATGAPVAILPAMSNGAYGGYVTVAYVQNVGSALANVRLGYFDQSGSGVGAGNSVLALAPFATWTVAQDNAHALALGQAGSATVYSDQPVAVFVNEFAPGGTDATSYSSIAALAGVGSTLFAPAIANNAYGGYTTGIGLVNLAAVAVTVTVTYRDTGGAVIKTQSFSMAAGAYIGLYSGDPALGLPNNFAGTATITSSGGNLAAVVNETGPGHQFSSYDAVPSGSTTLFAPVELRNAFGGYNTGTGIQNTTGTAGTVTITYYDSAGNPTVKTHSIAAYGYQGVYQGTDVPADGAYTARITSDVAIAAIVNETAPSGNQSTSYNTFASGSPTLHLPLVESAGADGWSTGEGIMNTGTAPTTVTVTYFDTSTGLQVGTPDVLLLGPNAFWGLYQPAGGLPNGDRASATVTTSGGGQVAVICNESNATSFMSYTAQ